MAEVLLYTVQFTGNNPAGEYVAGDIIEMFVETDDLIAPTDPVFGSIAGLFYKINGVVATGVHAFISAQQSNGYNIQNDISATICKDVFLIQFQKTSYAPYVLYTSLADHPSCAVDGPNCDLFIIGAPLVANASDAVTSDGSITITAESTNSIKYRLGFDFAYEDGNGQTSNVFSGLLPGSYNIFLRDELNCSAFINVIVGIGKTYGVRHVHEFADTDNLNTIRVEVLERDYVGASDYVCGSGQENVLIDLRGEGSENKFEPVLSINSVITLIANSDGEFNHLFTDDPDKFRVKYYENSVLKAVTKLLPNQGQEPYIAPPYYVNFTSQDGLPDLSTITFAQDNGEKFFGTVKAIKLIAYILQKINLGLGIRVAINLYADEMDEGDADDPLDQAYIDYDTFYIAEASPDLDFVLRSILESFKAQIIQWDGYWNIRRSEEIAQVYDYREFDVNGDYVTNDSYNPVKELDFPSNTPDLIFVSREQNLVRKPAFGTIKVIYSLGYRDNVILNGDFRLKPTFIPEAGIYSVSINRERFTLVNVSYPITEGYEIIDSNRNVAYLISGGPEMMSDPKAGNAHLLSDSYDLRMGTNNQIKFSLKTKIGRTSVQFGDTTYQVEVPYVKVRASVKYGPFNLDNAGVWSFDDAVQLTFPVDQFNTYTENEVTAGIPKWKEYSVDLATTTNISLTGEQTIDGVLTASSRVLVKNQTDPTENGIYISGAGIWTVPPDVDISYNNAVAYVDAGTINAGRTYIQRTRNATYFGRSWTHYTGSIFTGSNLVPTGMPFNVKVFHAFAYWAEYTDIDQLRELVTVNGFTGDFVVPTGTKKEVRIGFTGAPTDKLDYFSLQEGNDADNGDSILRPDDYGLGNERIWVRSNRVNVGTINGANVFPFYIDYIKAQFLTDGKSPIDTVIRQTKGQSNNNRSLESKFLLGSYSEVTSTIMTYGFDLGLTVTNSIANFVSTTVNILAANLIYTGFYRDADGIGFVNWHREGIAESDKMHGIALKSMAAQYNTTWRKITASIKAKNTKFGLLDVVKEMNDNGRIFMPMGVTLNAKSNTVGGEFLELVNVYENPGSDGSGQAPFSSGFSTGVGSGFN